MNRGEYELDANTMDEKNKVLCCFPHLAHYSQFLSHLILKEMPWFITGVQSAPYLVFAHFVSVFTKKLLAI